MKVTVNAVGFTADNSLKSFIERKLSKLDTFYDKIIDSHVYLKLDKGEKSSVAKKLVEVKVNVPGTHLFVREEGKSFEEATDISLGVLTRLVKKHKQKTNSVSHEKPQLKPDEQDLE